MAEVIVQNMRDPSQQVTIIVTIKKVILPAVDPGDPKWVLEASTVQNDEDGDLIPPVIKYLSNKESVTEDVNDLISELCRKIEWSYTVDTDPPKIVGYWPLQGMTGIEVGTEIIVNVTEEAPSSGIDLSSIRLKVKGFDLTDQLDIKGDLRACSITVTPGTKYKSALKKVL